MEGGLEAEGNRTSTSERTQLWLETFLHLISLDNQAMFGGVHIDICAVGVLGGVSFYGEF